MTARRLGLLSLLAVAVFLILLEVVRQALYPHLSGWGKRLALDAVVAAGFLVYVLAAFRRFGRLQAELDRRHQELEALHAAVLDVHGDLALEAVLQRVVEQARLLVGARYGALSVIGDDNRIRSFITAGVSDEERRRIGDPPLGRGLLGVVLHEGRRLRLADLGSDSRSAGFPVNHPPMKSLLAVPVPAKGGFHGNLYLTEKAGASEFSFRDEQTLARFATAAALAIDNAALLQRLSSLAIAEERVRIARELHDGMAQVLAYVNTKAQAVQELLRGGRTGDAQAHLEQLAAAAREVYTDAREGIFGLRTMVGPQAAFGPALAGYLETWSQQTGVEVRSEGLADETLAGGSAVELQLLRIVQEALANVRKHAAARRVDVTLAHAADRLNVHIVDDGRGFDPQHISRRGFPRFGLATMRERAESVGGRLDVESAPGQGTRVRISLPLEGITR